MPDLDFRITGVEPSAVGLVPFLNFKLEVANTPKEEVVHAVILQTQIQIQTPQRAYNAQEKEKLSDLFGKPEQWGQTLRGKLWTLAHTSVRSFSGNASALLQVVCTYDLNVLATKYFYALDGGEIPLLFLFSGTIFYPADDGRLQVQQIPWNKECAYRMPVKVWQDLMDHHYPQTTWLSLHRDAFERLYAYRRAHGIPTWEQTLERLLDAEEPAEVAP